MALEITSKLNEFCPIFRIKQVKLLLWSKLVQQNCVFSKILQRVNETKLTLENSFVVDHFALEGGKNSQYDERTSFGAPWSAMTCFLKLSERRIYVFFWTILVAAIFWSLTVAFTVHTLRVKQQPGKV